MNQATPLSKIGSSDDNEQSSLSTLFLVMSMSLTIRLCLYLYCSLSLYVSDSHIPFTEQWARWDSRHQITIADRGYSDPSLEPKLQRFIARFPPLQPLMIRIFSLNKMLSLTYTALLLSNIFLLLSSCWLFTLIKAETNSDKKAWTGVLLLNLFPTSYFFSTGHAESLFFLLLCAYFYAIRVQKNFGLASLYAGLATAARSVGIIVYPLHTWLLWKKIKSRDYSMKDFFYFLLPGLPFLIFTFYQRYINKLPGYLNHKAGEENFPLSLDLIPFTELAETVSKVWNNPDMLSSSSFVLTLWLPQYSILLASLVFLSLIRRVPIEYSLYGLTYMTLLSLISWNISAPRYLLCCLPLFVAFAYIESRWIRSSLLLTFAISLFYFSSIYVSGRFVF